MNEKLVEEWILKAEEDYKACLALDSQEVPNVICYHAHQCIEKYLKAFLISINEKPPWIHDLIRLNELAVRKDERLIDLDELLQKLNPYATTTRYPSWCATVDDVNVSIGIMKELRKKMRNFLDMEG